MQENMIPAADAAMLAWNLKLGWIWIVAGFISGALLGLGFQHENWLGGYSGFRRRLLRLGHISFFGTGLLNMIFFFTATLVLGHHTLRAASISFLIGAAAMPACCLAAAIRPALKPLFAIPVISLLVAGILTSMKVVAL